MDKLKQPGIQFADIFLVSDNFKRTVNIPEKIETTIDFNINYFKSEENNNFSLEIHTKFIGTNQGNEVLSLECTFVGIFRYYAGQENLNMDDFIRNNAPAIMFPYIREHISTTTRKAGFPQYLLPPINITAILNEKEENLNSLQS
jgi:preprotein translocase subunit SecB